MSQMGTLPSRSLEGERVYMMPKCVCDARVSWVSVSGKKLERIREGFLEGYLNWVLKPRWDLDLQTSGSSSHTAGTTWAKTGNREIMAIATTMIIIATFEGFPYMPITVISALYGHLLIPCNK